MPTCKDCIHFKICNDYVYLIGRETKVACPDYKSTEDVVPIAEVEETDKEIKRLKRILENYALQYGTVKDQQKVIEKAKQEVAKQIFEEIDTTIRTDIKANNRYYGDYQEGRNNAFYTLIRQLAELKKKYIEE